MSTVANDNYYNKGMQTGDVFGYLTANELLKVVTHRLQ